MTGVCRREEGVMKWRNKSACAGILIWMKKRLLRCGWVSQASSVLKTVPCSSLEIPKNGSVS